jgi:hypothetical protein
MKKAKQPKQHQEQQQPSEQQLFAMAGLNPQDYEWTEALEDVIGNIAAVLSDWRARQNTAEAVASADCSIMLLATISSIVHWQINSLEHNLHTVGRIQELTALANLVTTLTDSAGPPPAMEDT